MICDLPFLFIEYFFSLFSHFTKIMKKSLRSYKCSAFLLGRGQSFSSNVDGKANVFFFNSSSSLRNSTTSDVKVWFIYLVVLNCVHLPVAEFYLISFFYCWSSDLLKITIWNRTTRNIKCHFILNLWVTVYFLCRLFRRFCPLTISLLL